MQFLNFWDPAHTNHALAINGKSGTGKTLCTIALVSQLLCHGAQGVVIDRADHYAFLASLIPGARHLSIGHSDSQHAINPWDVADPAHVEPERITFLVDLHALLLGELDARRGAYGLTDRERIVLEDAVATVYRRAARKRGAPSPRERDLHAALRRARQERTRPRRRELRRDRRRPQLARAPLHRRRPVRAPARPRDDRRPRRAASSSSTRATSPRSSPPASCT